MGAPPRRGYLRVRAPTKWDGFRALAAVTDEGLHVTSRHGTDLTESCT
jgi:ATP-dependent DNA ligase